MPREAKGINERTTGWWSLLQGLKGPKSLAVLVRWGYVDQRSRRHLDRADVPDFPAMLKSLFELVNLGIGGSPIDRDPYGSFRWNLFVISVCSEIMDPDVILARSCLLEQDSFGATSFRIVYVQNRVAFFGGAKVAGTFVVPVHMPVRIPGVVVGKHVAFFRTSLEHVDVHVSAVRIPFEGDTQIDPFESHCDYQDGTGSRMTLIVKDPQLDGVAARIKREYLVEIAVRFHPDLVYSAVDDRLKLVDGDCRSE